MTGEGTTVVPNRAIRVLLVEDNPGDARLIREMLTEVRSATIELVCAGCLEEALLHTGHESFNVVLLDLNLPDSTGIETFIRLRDTRPEIPVVVLSGLDDENVAVHAVQDGAQDYLIKGHVDSDLLIRSILYAIERNRMSMAVRSLSLVDELTDLYNRRGFLTLAEQQLKMATRLKKNTAFIFLDLDDMKRINDTFGHHEGNRALQETAALLVKTCRDSDVVARLGGDEFILLAMLEDAKDSDILCKRLEENLAQGNARAGRQYQLSLSYGVTVHEPSSPTTLEEEITEADRRMYEQKKGKKAERAET